MKLMFKLSTLSLAAILFFASSAFAQGTMHAKSTSVLQLAPSAIFTLTLGFGDDHGNGNNGGNGCSNKGGNNWDGFGGNNNGGCKTVPEGGTTLTYLSLAGLCCLGAFVFRPRGQSSVLEARN